MQCACVCVGLGGCGGHSKAVKVGTTRDYGAQWDRLLTKAGTVGRETGKVYGSSTCLSTPLCALGAGL